MIEPLRFYHEEHSTYEIERAAFCALCVAQRETKNNPNVAIYYCKDCPASFITADTRGANQKKQLGALLCLTCLENRHSTGLGKKHGRQMIVVGPGIRKKIIVRGDGVNFPMPLDQVYLKMRAKIYHHGNCIAREPPTFMDFTAGLSGKCLHIQLLGARNLRVADMNGTSDPFVIYSFCGKQLSTTRIRHRTLNPHWDNESVVVPLEDSMQPPRNMLPTQKDLVKLQVYDKDWLSQNEFLGQVELHRSKLMKLAQLAGDKPVRVPLTARTYAGIIHIQVGVTGSDKHPISTVHLRIVGVEDIFRRANPFVRVYLGSRLVGKTSTVHGGVVHALWHSGNDITIRVNDLLQAERELGNQIRAYRKQGVHVGVEDPAGVGGVTGAVNADGDGEGEESRTSNFDALFADFDTLPDSLALLRIEVNDFVVLRDGKLGEVYVSSEMLRDMLPPDFPRPLGPEDANTSTKSFHFSYGDMNKGKSSSFLTSFRGLFRGGRQSSNLRSSSANDIESGLYRPERGRGGSVGTNDFSESLENDEEEDDESEGGTHDKNQNEEEEEEFTEQTENDHSAIQASIEKSRESGDDGSPTSSQPPVSAAPEGPVSKSQSQDNQSQQQNKAPSSAAEGKEHADQESRQSSREQSRQSSRGKASLGRHSPQTQKKPAGKAVVTGAEGDRSDRGNDERSRQSSREQSRQSSRGKSKHSSQGDDFDNEELSDDFGDEEEREGEGEGEEEMEGREDGEGLYEGEVGEEEEEEQDEDDGYSYKLPANDSSTVLSSSVSNMRGYFSQPVPEWSNVYRLTLSNDLAVSGGEQRSKEDLGFIILRLLVASRGTVLRGIDCAAQRMTVGETSVVRVRYDLGYGNFNTNTSVDIPPRSNIVFTMKLVAVNGAGRLGIVMRLLRRGWRVVAAFFLGLLYLLTCNKGKAGGKGRRGGKGDYDSGTESEGENDGEFGDEGDGEGDEDATYDNDSSSLGRVDGRAGGMRATIRPDRRMRRHLNPSVEAGARLIWGYTPPPKPPPKEKRAKKKSRQVLEDDNDSEEDEDNYNNEEEADAGAAGGDGDGVGDELPENEGRGGDDDGNR